MSSSSKKKRSPIQRCRHCDCLFLAKDIDCHRVGQQTPKGPSANKSEDGEGRCAASDFRHSQIALIRPHFGLTLRRHNKGQATDSANRWEGLFPVSLCGWTRHHAALTHPETFDIAGIRPKSALLWLSEGGECTKRLLSLWPSAEIPPMQILLPNSLLFCDESLLPKLSGSELSLEHWAKLADLAHFPLFVRSYFGDALICAHSDELELFYYGQRLIFCVFGMEFEDASEQKPENGEVQREAIESEDKCPIDGENKDWRIHRISPMCAFDICWDEVLLPVRVYNGNAACQGAGLEWRLNS
uniref:DUF295 domain-containing protein n=1 Tax=Globodera pallida TaxID=36090 RepID=A0A183BWR1_GLOPA